MTRRLMLASSAVILLASQVAVAKPKVALTQIEGDASGDIHEAVSEALEGKELAVIGSKEVNRAVDKLGDLADLTEKDFKKLANELEADAIVFAKLGKVGSSRTLRFRLFIHKKMAKGFTVSFKNAKSEKFRSMLHDKMVDKIGAAVGDDEDDRSARKRGEDGEEVAQGQGQGQGKKDKKLGKRAKAEEDEEDRPARKTRVAEDEDRSSKKARAEDDEDDGETRPAKVQRADGEDAERADGEDEAEDDDAPRRGKKKVAAGEDSEDGDEVEAGVTARAEPRRGAHRPAARVDIGMSVLQRRFKFNSRSDFPEGPQGVGLAPVPGARFQAEVYPLGMSSGDGALANLGIGVHYDRTISLHVDSTNEMGVKVPVKQSSYSVGLRYRMAFGQRATSPTLTLGVGYGKRLFAPDTSVLMEDRARDDIRRDTPHSHYTLIDPGVMFRLPVTRMVALAAGGRGLAILNTGAIGTLRSYGQARVYGVEGTLALDVVLGRFALRFSGELTQIGCSFDGVGALSRGLDADVSTADVGGLADRSIGGAATLAVTY